jgi:hypothetical protein
MLVFLPDGVVAEIWLDQWFTHLEAVLQLATGGAPLLDGAARPLPRRPRPGSAPAMAKPMNEDLAHGLAIY